LLLPNHANRGASFFDDLLQRRLQRLAGERAGLIQEMERGSENEPRFIKGDDGVFRFLSRSVASSLYRRCYDDGLVDHDFDWVTWTQSAEYGDLRGDPTKLQVASPEQLSRLLTALVREERFSYGAWAVAVQSGFLVGVVERAATLSI